ncbi:hypothetical protein AOC36_04035 [Erysipelothrix larvae]|uniref:Bacterial type II secretion system protein E domain-containing protein n=1 Tax=Erysipelothrix larvae TaxID=1514105 RepID=A0A0X8GZD6_9FIRM|nr:GspE/PulE family protein [Erysipelothrix larvae]AMC93169.1 hypothetical protein AOC36_04035 [Erysipelothrix larvae]
MKNLKLGELLVNDHLITQEQLDDALEIQREVHKKLGQIFIEMQLISENELLTVLADKLGFHYSEQPLSLVENGIQDVVSSEFVRANKILPLYIKNGTLYAATNDPLDFATFEDLSMITGLDTRPIVSPLSKIEQGIGVVYSFTDENISEADKLSIQEEQLMQRVDSAPVVKLVNQIISNAQSLNASDIHIEPEEDVTKIRYRIDGILSDQMTLKKELHDLITTRIKIISGMNIAEKRSPQDGAFRIQTDFLRIDIRASSIPTPKGEKIVLRLLGSDRNVQYELSKIDISDTIKDKLRKISQVPNGILLLTGPTGSGKTTTLYSLLHEIATRERSVVTIEDPVEKQFDGITQVQVNPRAGLTFATGLRSIMRQDPDVIMVGEIRDTETATIAIRAAITGHFVLSTLHTNDAIASIARLVDMGVEPFMVASSVKAVLAQRLVRKVCPHCATKEETSPEDRRLLGDPNLTHTMKGGGCERCDHTGYLGRSAVFEIVFVDEVIQDMIASGAKAQEIREYAKTQDSQFLQDDILRLVREGKTTVQEARRILFSID